MSAEEQAESQQAETTEEASALDQILNLMPKSVKKDQGTDWVANLAAQAAEGSVTWDTSVTASINNAIKELDTKLSRQLAEVMHAEQFQKLEGSWRGLHHLIHESETSATLKLKVLNLSKKELYKDDLAKAIEFDQSLLFKKIYENEFGMPGGEPYGALIGDFEFSKSAQDVDLLEKISGVAAAAHCPFVSAASADLFGLDDWSQLSKPRDLEKIFMQKEYIKWNAFRDSEDSRYVSLVLPRVLARNPYGLDDSSTPIDEFDYEELELTDAKGNATPPANNAYCWMNAAYVMGANMTRAHASTSWCTAIRGVENGGKVEGLPVHTFTSTDGDTDMTCPTEIAITDRREAELSQQGFLPLCHFKNTDYSVFFGAQTCQRPKVYDTDEATANAAISARLPYMMAASRISHYLKCIARDKIGSFAERADVEDFLKRWIAGYVSMGSSVTAELKAKFPLAEAEITVEEVPGSPGSYNAVAHLRPWLQMEELTTSIRMVSKLPAKA